MAWVLRLVFWLPAWCVLILAGGTFYAGTQLLAVLEAEQQQMQAAGRLPPPALTDFAEDTPLEPGEVALRTKVFDEAAYWFYYGEGGPNDLYEYFYFLEEPGATATDNTYSAVVVFESDDRRHVQKWWDSILVNPANNKDLVDLRGYAARTDYLAQETSDALAAMGGVRSENFIYIRPFIDGRDAFFEGNAEEIELFRYGLWGAVGVMLLWALIRQLIGRRKPPLDATAGRAGTVISAASSVVGLAGADYLDEEEDTDDAYGIAMSIGKFLLGLFLKNRASKKSKASAQAGAVATPPPVPATVAPAEVKPAIYSPHRQLYCENGFPIDAVT